MQTPRTRAAATGGMPSAVCSLLLYRLEAGNRAEPGAGISPGPHGVFIRTQDPGREAGSEG